MQRLRLGLERSLNPSHAALLIAQEHGWYFDVGIHLELIELARRPGASDPIDPIAAIEAGAIELAITRPSRLVRDRSAGKPAVGLARFLHTNGGVMYLEGFGIERPRDMIGKRVQYPGGAGELELATVKTMVEQDGGECDVADLVPVDNGLEHTDALIEGRADVATPIFYNIDVIEARGRGQRPEFFSLKNWGVPDFCQLVLVTTEKIFHEKRQLLETALRTLRRGVDAAHEQPTAAKIIYERVTESRDPLAATIFDATLPCFTYDFTLTHDYYRRLQEWMEDTGQIERGLVPRDYWTNELAL